MTRSSNDHLVFYRHLKGKTIILVAYIDDLIIIGDDGDEISAMKKFLSKHFHIIDLGKLKYFLGIEVLRSYDKLLLCQRKYMLDMLTESGLLGCKPVDSPMIPETKLMTEDGELLHDPERYRRLVGKLNFLIVMGQFISAPHTT